MDSAVVDSVVGENCWIRNIGEDTLTTTVPLLLEYYCLLYYYMYCCTPAAAVVCSTAFNEDSKIQTIDQ